LPDGIFSDQKSKIWVNFGGSCSGRYWNILWPFGVSHGNYVYFIAIRYMFTRFGMLYQDKSGNPDAISSESKENKVLAEHL
jgi:hypothetical protein